MTGHVRRGGADVDGAIPLWRPPTPGSLLLKVAKLLLPLTGKGMECGRPGSSVRGDDSGSSRPNSLTGPLDPGAKGRDVPDETSGSCERNQHGGGTSSAPDAGFPRVGGRIELVLLDVGGPIYDDAAYRDALLRATRELAAERGNQVSEADFLRVYDEQRQAQQGSLRTTVAERLLSAGDRQALSDRAREYWLYPPSALYEDVVPALRRLAGRYRIAVVANQRSVVRQALQRDGVADHVDIWAISDVVGAEKPDPAIFEHALRQAGVRAENAVHVGNRLDTDVRGASRVGLRTVWVLRGEAPPRPTVEQLREPDEAISSLAELPGALDRLGGGAR